jgi:hypothetical protein
MTEETRIFPKSSAFEALLARVYMELWELQDQPALFASRVEKFARVFLPSMFQGKIREKLPDFDNKLDKMEAEVDRLKRAQINVDPFTADMIERGEIPSEKADFAEDVWHAIVDVLTDAGFNFPVARKVPRRRMGA